MSGIHLIGHGGMEMLKYRVDISAPIPGPEVVLIQVTAAGMNNTDFNTRTGWYNQPEISGTTAKGAAKRLGLRLEIAPTTV